MAEFDEKLNSILADPNAMSRIMQLAQSLSGNTADPPPPQPSPSTPEDPPAGIDPALLMRLLPLLRELEGQQDSNAQQLLYALRPYLKPERREKIQRALQLARLFRLGKHFLAGREG